jgi:hypothetical protein
VNTKLKTVLVIAASAVTLNLLPAGFVYACTCYGDAAQMYQSVLTSFMPFITKVVGGTGASAEQTISESGAAVRAEILKSATASKAVEEGLEAYRQQQDLQETALTLQDTMKQPPTTCQSLATSTGISTATQNAQARAFSGQAKTLSRLASNTNTVQVLEVAHQESNASFCTPEEAARGVCSVNTAPKYVNLAGADQEASFLFQAKDGSASYEGADTVTSNSAQSAAVDGYINRIIGGMAPEQLRGKGVDYYSASPQARAYVELNRRYNSFMSMGSYSLQQIKELHRTQVGLGTATKMDNAPGFPAGKADMSPAEVAERFVATKFSPTSVQALATATETPPILRDIAQMNSFQLWMSYQGLLQSSRFEGLMAHQLALIAEQTLRPQVDAQRAAAVRAENSAQRAQ